MDGDAEFRQIAIRIVDENYLAEINQYKRDNVGERMSQGVNLKINQKFFYKMKKNLLLIILALSANAVYSQQYDKQRDSLMKLQRESSELYLKHKDGNPVLADRYLEESNRYFQQTVDYTVDYIVENPSMAEKIIGQDIYMFDRDADKLLKVLELIRTQPQFDAKLKAKVENLYNKAADKVIVGKIAYDFTLKNEKGETVSLSDYKGKYIWLNFWASWCAPCRAKSRYVVNNYESIKNDELIILSVSFDESEKLWLDASKKDGLFWISLRNTEGFAGNIKENYKIESLPTTFLLDKEMKIIVHNPTIDKIKEIINKK